MERAGNSIPFQELGIVEEGISSTKV